MSKEKPIKPIKPSVMSKEKPIKPIKPSEMAHNIPDEIIKAFNCLITEKWDGKQSIVKQNEVLKIALKYFDQNGKTTTDQEIFQKRYLDVEETFRSVGWDVDYSKPAYNEDYEAYYIFKR